MGPRLYRALLALFPPGFRKDVGHEAAEAFSELWREAPGRRARLALLARGVGHLPGGLAAEWWITIIGRRREGMEGWWRNVRLAARMLRRNPTFALSTVLLTGLGVGAVTTIFTVVDHVLLRPLPYPEADRLVLVERGSHSGPLFEAFGDVGTIEAWAGASDGDVNLVGEGDPLRLRQARVSRRFFEVFGGGAIRGRMLAEEDYDATGAVLLDGDAWRTVWGGDPDVVGRTITLDGEPATIVGVLDPDFEAPEAMVGREVDLWRPLDWSSDELAEHDYSLLTVTGRRTPTSSVEAVQAEIDAVMGRMAGVHINYREEDGSPRGLPVTPLTEVTVRGVRAELGLLLGAVGLLLLVACANVAHLFLARGLGRQREMAVRRAMGAGTGGLVRQLLVESLVVGIAGGMVGLGLASVGLRALLALLPEALPRQAGVTLDLRVLGFAVLISAVTALVFGLLPALRSVQRDVANEIRGSGRSQTASRGVQGFRNLLVAGEVALSLVLVAGAGLLLRSFLSVQGQDPGFETAGVWTIPITPRGIDDRAEWVSHTREILRSLEAVPGVQEAAYGLTAPLQYTGGSRCCWSTSITVEGRERPQRTYMHPVSLDYLTTFGIGIVAGRSWTASESATQPLPMVLTEPAALGLFGSVDGAVGRTFAFGDGQAVVVGVAADNHHYGLESEAGPSAYMPVEQVPFAANRAHMAVRLRDEPTAATIRSLREAVWAAAPGMPIPIVRSMDEWMERDTASRRFDSVLFGAFAGIALLLAAGGLYGTLLYVAGERRRELGIRLALGASRARIERQLLGTGLLVAGLGVVAGLFGAWASGRWLESRLWGVESGDPLTLGLAGGLLLATAALASWLPARRAGRTDPLETLRVE